MSDTTISRCPSCNQEMHPVDYFKRLRSELAAAKQQIADLETLCDPAGIVRENTRVSRNNIELLSKIIDLKLELVAANEAREKAERRAEENEKQLRAAKYIVWCAQWSFRKLQSVRKIMPHAECDYYVSMQPQVEKWLAGNDQVGVDFTEGNADLMVALAAIDAARTLLP